MKISLLFSAGPVQKMEPLNNLQVAIKNNIDVFYFSCLVPAHVFFVEGGKMGKWENLIFLFSVQRFVLVMIWKKLLSSTEFGNFLFLQSILIEILKSSKDKSIIPLNILTFTYSYFPWLGLSYDNSKSSFKAWKFWYFVLQLS